MGGESREELLAGQELMQKATAFGVGVCGLVFSWCIYRHFQHDHHPTVDYSYLKRRELKPYLPWGEGECKKCDLLDFNCWKHCKAANAASQ